MADLVLDVLCHDEGFGCRLGQIGERLAFFIVRIVVDLHARILIVKRLLTSAIDHVVFLLESGTADQQIHGSIKDHIDVFNDFLP